MKLLIVARPFAFHGGVERATAGLLAALVDHGHDVHLLSLRGQGAVAGVTLHTLRLPPLPATGRMLAFAARVRVVLARKSWDVIQSHERTLGQQVYRAGEGCHRAYLACCPPRGGRSLYHRVVLTLERQVLARTPRIVAIARAGRGEIQTLYGVVDERLAVVYNGVDLERFHPSQRARHREAARAEAGLPPTAWVLLFVGSGFERKGLDRAIEALHRVGDPEARLLVVGRGSTGAYRARAGRLGVAERVVWLGARPDVERWYAAADVLLLPARYEPFGNVHLEALASGLPVVASRYAGGSEVVRDGVNGVVVDPADGGALAQGLERVRDLAARDVAGAARRSAEPFTYAAQVAGFERVYRGLS